MAPTNALKRAILRAIARGKPKTAARLEADDKIRRGLWKAHEERVLKMMAGGTGERGSDDAQAILHAGLVDAYDGLTRSGYTKERAAALVQRLATKANREQLDAIGQNMATPPPNIQPSARASVRMPELRRQTIFEGQTRLLDREYPTAKPGDIKELNGELYMRVTSNYGSPTWVGLK